MSIADQILAAASQALNTTEFTRPEWGNVTVLVRELTGAERASYDSSSAKRVRQGKDPDLTPLYLLVLTRCVLDPATKQPVFSDDQAKSLMRTSGAAVAAAVNLAMGKGEMAADDEEEILGNFSFPGTEEAIPTSGGTTSPPDSAGPSSSP